MPYRWDDHRAQASIYFEGSETNKLVTELDWESKQPVAELGCVFLVDAEAKGPARRYRYQHLDGRVAVANDYPTDQAAGWALFHATRGGTA